MTMLESITAFLAGLKQASPLVFLAILIATGFILFAPVEIATTLGLSQFRDEYRSLLGGGFVLAASIVVVQALHKSFRKLRRWRRRQRIDQINRQRLHELTPDERGYLEPYILGEIATQQFLMDDGVARGLEAKDILYRPSSMFDLVEGAPFNIQPWAKAYPQKNPELIGGGILPKRYRRERIR